MVTTLASQSLQVAKAHFEIELAASLLLLVNLFKFCSLTRIWMKKYTVKNFQRNFPQNIGNANYTKICEFSPKYLGKFFLIYLGEYSFKFGEISLNIVDNF